MSGARQTGRAPRPSARDLGKVLPAKPCEPERLGSGAAAGIGLGRAVLWLRLSLRMPVLGRSRIEDERGKEARERLGTSPVCGRWFRGRKVSRAAWHGRGSVLKGSRPHDVRRRRRQTGRETLDRSVRRRGARSGLASRDPSLAVCLTTVERTAGTRLACRRAGRLSRQQGAARRGGSMSRALPARAPSLRASVRMRLVGSWLNRGFAARQRTADALCPSSDRAAFHGTCSSR